MSAFAKFITITSNAALVDGVRHNICNACRAHFGLQIVRGDFGRLHHLAFFATEGLLRAAIEEIRHMRVLFGFGDAKVLVI